MGEKHKYDLEDRTREFAQKVRSFIRKVPKTLTNIEECRQLAKASGSVGANYFEANESISRKDFEYRIKVCRKEVKESRYFLSLIDVQNDDDLLHENHLLQTEST